MGDQDKPEKPFLGELQRLRERISELETVEARHKRAKEALRESEQKYRFLVDNSEEIILILNKRAKIIFANKFTLTNFGYSKEELIDRPITRFLTEDSSKITLRAIAEEFLRHPQPEIEVRAKTKSGEIRHLRVAESSVPIYEKEKLIGVMISASDVTEHKKAEEQLRESEERFRSVVEHSHEGIFIVDDAYRFIYSNSELSRILGYPPEEIIDQDFRKFLDDESKRLVSNRYVRRQRGEEIPSRYEFNVVRKDGRKRRVAISSTVVKDSNGAVRTVAQILDITESKRAEEALRESEEKFRNLAEKLPNMIFINKKGKVVYANEKCEEIMGYRREEICSPDFDFFIMIAPESRDKIKTNFARHMKDKEVPPLEYALLTREGRRIEAVLTTKLIDFGGEKAILGIVTDITERKKATKALQASEAELRALIAAMTDVILVLDVHGRYLKIPPTNPKLLYKPAPELIGKTMHEIFPQAQADFFLGSIRRSLETCQPVNIEYCLSIEGEEIWFSGTISPMTEDTVIWVARDITNRKLAERRLQASEAKYRGLLENVFDGVYQSTPGGKFLLANPAIVRMLGYDSEEELLAINVRDIYMNPEDRDIFARKIEEKGEVRNLELALKRKDGQRLTVLLNARLMQNEIGECYYEGTLTDITDLKRADEQIKASLAEKEILLREIHHRVKNNMQIISSFLNLQASQMKDDNVLKMSKESQSRIRSMALVHEKLYRSKDFSHINFSDYIRSLATHMFQFNQVNPNFIQLKMDLEDVLLDIQTAIPCGLILNELITNSIRHAFPKDKRGEIGVELHPVGNHAIQMIVKDNGVGIPEDMDIQDPKSFGLQIVKTLVDQLEGNMEVQRKDGAIFNIIFKELRYKTRL